MWQIKYQDAFFLIEPGQNPEMQRNSPLFLIDNLLSEVSTPFRLRYSDTMSPVINHLFFELTKKTKLEIEVELYTKGSFRCNATMVIDNAEMNQVYASDSNVAGYLKTGISSFFATIKDKKLIDLNLGGTRTIDFTTEDPTDLSDGFWQAFQNTWAFEDDYVIAPYKNLQFVEDDPQFYASDGWANKLDVDSNLQTSQPVVPFVKFEYVLNAIFQNTGWKLNTTGLNDDDWKKLLLYSNYLIETNNYLDNASHTPKASVSFDLAKAMPADVTCSKFILECCKRYFWFPSADVNSRTINLIALKETGRKSPKDWTAYVKAGSASDFSQDEKVFAFTNNFEGADEYPAAPDLDAYPQKGFVYSEALLPNPNTVGDYDNVIYFAYMQNAWYKTEWNGAEIAWVAFAQNIYDEKPANATETFETAVTTLPVVKAQFENGHYGYVPIVNQPKLSGWGIRTVLYHGMTKMINGSNAPIDVEYPYISCTNQPPSNANAKLKWANVFKYSDFEKDYGIVQYWASRWLQMIASTEKITRGIDLPFHELINFKWDDVIIINNLCYFVLSLAEPLDYDNYILAELVPVNPVTIAAEEEEEEDEDVHFTTQEEISVGPLYQTKLQYLLGPAGAVVTIEVIEFDHTDTEWYFKVNDVDKLEGNTFTVTLDGSGHGYFTAKIGRGAGGTIPGNLARVQITAVTIGAIGSPDIAQYNKSII